LDRPHQDDSSNKALIISLSVVGGLLLLGLIGFGAWYYYKKKNRKFREELDDSKNSVTGRLVIDQKNINTIVTN
jgi:hypothetical protein